MSGAAGVSMNLDDPLVLITRWSEGNQLLRDVGSIQKPDVAQRGRSRRRGNFWLRRSVLHPVVPVRLHQVLPSHRVCDTYLLADPCDCRIMYCVPRDHIDDPIVLVRTRFKALPPKRNVVK